MRVTRKRLWVFLLVLPLVLFSQRSFSRGIHATIEKTETATWTVSYRASEPIERIAFRSNPDNSRSERWKTKDDGFEIIFDNGQEFIVKKDGSKFSQVTFFLTPTHQRFAKAYAPFSPYSDGGTLIHSGRFFACENICENSLNEWELTLAIPKGEHVILNGEVIASEATWLASNSGEKVYVGLQKPVQANGFIAVIDESLPSKIKNSLDSYIPKLTAYFESTLGGLPDTVTPQLFVSFSQTKGPSIRGGVLPNQIFVHLDQDDLEKFASDENFLHDLQWTFAHEIAHFFQQSGKLNIRKSESWIHEGHAEMLAYGALKHLDSSAHQYSDTKVAGFKKKCADGLKSTSLQDAAQNGEFDAYYACGFLIYQSIANSYSKELERDSSPYVIWKQFSSTAEPGVKTSEESFVVLLALLRGDAIATAISQFIKVKHSDPAAAVSKLLSQQ